MILRKFTLLYTIALMLIGIDSSNAQNQDISSTRRPGRGMTCADPSPFTDNCSNMIYNSDFSVNAGNATNTSFVPGWDVAFGTPDLYSIPGGLGNGTPATANYVFLRDKEGIAQKISPMHQGKMYLLSFFHRTQFGNPSAPANYPLGFKMVLLKCRDYMEMVHHIGDNYPVLPAASQTIYCASMETSPLLGGPNWINFTANDDYDILLIYPQLNSEIVVDGELGIFFAYPECYPVNLYTIPTPTPDCIVNLPAAQCTAPINSVFHWYGPNGQIIIAAFNQTVPIDASNPLNVGTWSLYHTTTGGTYGNASNICSYNGGAPGLTIEVTPCLRGQWPKAYATRPSQSLFKTDSGQLVMGFSSLPSSPYMNHNGPYAPYGTASSLQYDFTGLTTWYSNANPVFPLHNGTLQMDDYSYYDAATGALTTGPAEVPANERIIAETGSGSYISADGSSFTYTGNQGLIYTGQIYVHVLGGGLSTPINVNGYVQTKFNAASNKLFVISNNTLFVYAISGNTYNPIAQTTYTGSFAQITDNDKVYVVHDNQLAELDYSGSAGSYTIVSAAGFNNNSIGNNFNSGTFSNNPYVENRVLVMNTTDNYFYSVDLSDMTSRKIQVSYPPYYNSIYAYNGDDIYLSFEADAPYTIGTQQIPLNGTTGTLSAFTKLNLNTDFAARPAFRSASASIQLYPSFNTTVAPNPANSYIKIDITNTTGQKGQAYRIIIRNILSGISLNRNNYVSGATIDVSGLEKGLHIVEITDVAGNKINTRFVKLN
jgi:hypothetical protein